MTNQPNLHVEIVTGIAQYILAKKGRIKPSDCHSSLEYACRDKSENARNLIKALIFEHGIVADPKDIESLLINNQSDWLWMFVNQVLERYYKLNSVSPEKILL